MSADALAALDELLRAPGDADDVLRGAVEVLLESTPAVWAGIAFVEAGSLALGPAAGVPDETRRVAVPIEFQGAGVGELWVDGEVDAGLLEQVAARLGEHVLIGWDTRGEPWDP